MRKLDVNQLEIGMILGAPIVDAEGVVELLSRGTTLTKRHIALITQMGPMDVYVLDHERKKLKKL